MDRFSRCHPITVTSNQPLRQHDCESILALKNPAVCTSCYNSHYLFIFCIYGFSIILSVNRDYYLKQHLPVGVCNGEVLCFLGVRTEFLNDIGMSFVFKEFSEVSVTSSVVHDS
jgi:hypothetical protein